MSKLKSTRFLLKFSLLTVLVYVYLPFVVYLISDAEKDTLLDFMKIFLSKGL